MTHLRETLPSNTPTYKIRTYMTNPNPPKIGVEELVKELRMVSNMINMGEKIAWGRDTTLMDEAADMLTTIYQQGVLSEREWNEELREWAEGIVAGTAFSGETGLIWQHWLDEGKRILTTPLT